MNKQPAQSEAILLHGICDAEEYYEMDFPSPSNAHWFPWLQQKFLRAGVLCQALEMPKPYEPSYEVWRTVFERHYTPNLRIAVGHSAGCGFILKWLAANPSVTLDRLVLVAPYCDPFGQYGDFLVGVWDDALERRIGQMDVFYAENEDVTGVKETVDRVMTTYPSARLHVTPTGGHFCFGDLGGPEFPALRDCLSLS